MFAAMARYFFKGNNPIRKIMVGTLYTYWLNHFFTLSAYTGVSLHLPCRIYNKSKGPFKSWIYPRKPIWEETSST